MSTNPQPKRNIRKKAVAVTVGTVALVGTVAGTAAAYWTNDSVHEHASATTQSGVSRVLMTAPAITNLYPGATQEITIHMDNRLNDYAVGFDGLGMNVNSVTNAEGKAVNKTELTFVGPSNGFVVPAKGTLDVKGTVTLAETGHNQDGWKGAVVDLTFWSTKGTS